MKTIKILSLTLISSFILSLSGVIAQTTPSKSKKQTIVSETTFKVGGSCGMCKDRIEKAAKFKGVSTAEWNTKTHLLKLVYNPSEVKVTQVQQKIAAVGHDAGKLKADPKTYKALPGCCQYDRL